MRDILWGEYVRGNTFSSWLMISKFPICRMVALSNRFNWKKMNKLAHHHHYWWPFPIKNVFIQIKVEKSVYSWGVNPPLACKSLYRLWFDQHLILLWKLTTVFRLNYSIVTFVNEKNLECPAQNQTFSRNQITKLWMHLFQIQDFAYISAHFT